MCTSGRGRTTTSRSASPSTSPSAAGACASRLVLRALLTTGPLLCSALRCPTFFVCPVVVVAQGRPLRALPRRHAPRRLLRALPDLRERAAVRAWPAQGWHGRVRVRRPRGVGRGPVVRRAGACCRRVGGRWAGWTLGVVRGGRLGGVESARAAAVVVVVVVVVVVAVVCTL